MFCVNNRKTWHFEVYNLYISLQFVSHSGCRSGSVLASQYGLCKQKLIVPDQLEKWNLAFRFIMYDSFLFCSMTDCINEPKY